MSINRLSAKLMSIDGDQLYEIPKGMYTVHRVAIGSRSLNFGISKQGGKRYIVLFPAIEVSGVEIELVGLGR